MSKTSPREVLVSVVIPTYNGGKDFRRCLEGIFSQRVDFPFEVVCIDSGSRDGTLEVARAFPVRVLQIPSSEFNHGLTRNLGIRESRGKYAVLLTQDAVPYDEHWLAPLVENFEADSRVAGVYSQQIPRPDCNPFIKARLKKWAAGRQERVVQEIGDPERFESLPPLEKLKIIAFDNVSSSLRREVWETIPFDKRNFGEDVFWGYKVIRSGHRIVYEPRSKVVHSHNNSIWYEFKRVYLDHQNLNHLIGLCTVPTFSLVFVCSCHGAGEYWRLLRNEEMVALRRLLYGIKAVFFTLGQNLGQYLGAHSNRWLKEKPWFQRVDRFLRKGV